MGSCWWPLSIKAPVLGINRGRVSFPSDLTCLRRLKMFWVQKIIFFIFGVFKVLQCRFYMIIMSGLTVNLLNA